MQCRICLEDGTPRTLSSPCHCRGTSKFIHRTCLDQYIQYYPDRICRVCLSPLSPVIRLREGALALGILLVLGGLILLSEMRTLGKIVLGGSVLGVVITCCMYSLINSISLMGLSTLIILFLPHHNPVAVTVWIMGFGSVAIVTTLARRIPAIIILKIILAVAISAYGVFVLVLASLMMDSPAFTALVCVLFLAWYGWIQRDARLPLE
jgi:hypothetical protein